jgi:large subunit ribosomal protein L14
MIFKDSYIYIVDNTGVSVAKCISISRNFKKNYASVGESIVCVLKKVRSQIMKKKKTRIYKGEIHQILLVSQLFPFMRKDGSSYSVDINAGIVLIPPKIKKQKNEP